MSIHRCLSPLTSSSFTVFRFAANIDVTLRALPYTLRNFNSGPQNQLSSKRKLQTATAYRPNSLDSIPQPPPLNALIPESSIAGGVPQVNDTRPPLLTGTRTNPPPPPCQTETPPFIVPEAQAQKTTPVPEAAKSRPKESRLRARKAAMTLTPSATSQIRNLLSLPEPKMIRVGVKNRGCSGLAYHLEYVERPGKFDETVEQDGVKVLIDSKALFSIIGSEMDWVEDKLNARFVFRNPNISQSRLYLSAFWRYPG
ncbi:Iron-sulfur assembly protein 1 [Peltigera leucophlebia]|nr:Iron-sulfur assembly protein 1 [Peltigera leucophlebia]